MILPLKAMTPSPYLSKIRPTSCPGRSKIVFAKGHGGRNTWFCTFFLSAWHHNKSGAFPVGPSQNLHGKCAKIVCPAALWLAPHILQYWSSAQNFDLCIESEFFNNILRNNQTNRSAVMFET
jgi:hypothetical protein